LLDAYDVCPRCSGSGCVLGVTIFAEITPTLGPLSVCVKIIISEFFSVPDVCFVIALAMDRWFKRCGRGCRIRGIFHTMVVKG